MTQDPIADMLTIIRNGYLAHLQSVNCKKSKIKLELAKLLVKLGFLKKIEEKDNNLQIELVYDRRAPAITKIQRVSKPGLRIYQNLPKLRKNKSRLTIKILSTPQGLMTDRQAISKNLGGEVIALVY